MSDYVRLIPAGDRARFEYWLQRCVAAWQARDLQFFGYPR